LWKGSDWFRYIPTIGVDYGVKVVDIKPLKTQAAVHFFDLSGCEDMKNIRQDFYKDAQVIFNRDV